MIAAESAESQTKVSAPSCTDRHRDHVLDQTRDHGTKYNPWSERISTALLEAVAAGDPRSLELAKDLVAAVLASPILRRASELEELLRAGSPFALVRAVALAEDVLSNDTGIAAKEQAREQR